MTTPTFARRRRAALVACLAWFAVSWVLRVLHRGLYFPGCGVAGAAEGLWLVSTRSKRPADPI